MLTSISKSLLLVSILLFSFSTHAQTWTGAVSGDMNLASNWSPQVALTGSSELRIPGSGITNWPYLTSNISISALTLEAGSQMDTRGYAISVFKFASSCLVINGATVKNSIPGTDIIFKFGGQSSIKNSTFNGNSSFEFSGMFLTRYYYDSAIEGSNHFIGKTKFKETGNTTFYISQSASIYDGDVEFERGNFGGPTSTLYSELSSLFYGGGTIKGNFKYTSLVGGELTFGSTTANTHITGNAEIIHSGRLNVKNKIIVDGISTFKAVGTGLSSIFSSDQTNPFAFRNLEIAKTGGGSVSFGNNLIISGNLTFTSGSLSVNDGVLIFAKGATTSGASNSSHIVGEVQKIGNEEFTFPVGDGTTLMPLIISAPSGINDKFSVKYNLFSPNGNPYTLSSKEESLTKIDDHGYWDVKRLTGASDVQITLGYNIQSGYISTTTDLRVAHWQGTKWEDLGNGGASGSLTNGKVASATAVSLFSPFTIASAGPIDPLPVILTKFSAQKENGTALLSWSSTGETNSDRFEIECSQDAKSWRKLGLVNAAKESGSLLNYAYVHNTPFTGVNYYRLKMVDLDETFTYSKIVSLEFAGKTQLVVYPNPVAGRLYIKAGIGAQINGVKIINNFGKNILEFRNVDFTQGFNLSSLTEGIYFVNIALADGGDETHKILLQR